MFIYSDRQHVSFPLHQQIQGKQISYNLGHDAVVLGEQDRTPSHTHSSQRQYSGRQTILLDNEPMLVISPNLLGLCDTI